MFCSTSIFTLFPYTTLFRSAKFQVVQIPSRRMHANNAAVSQEATIIFRAENDRRLLGNSGIVGVQDRKSTRLNSSHRTISYAVFCLKKKTTLFTISSYLISC